MSSPPSHPLQTSPAGHGAGESLDRSETYEKKAFMIACHFLNGT